MAAIVAYVPTGSPPPDSPPVAGVSVSPASGVAPLTVCFGCDPSLCKTAVSSTQPVVHVTVNGRTTDIVDSGQILNTHGVDSAGCPDTGTRNDESEAWQRIG